MVIILMFLLGGFLGSGLTFLITRSYFRGLLHSNLKAYIYDINIIRMNNHKLLRTNRLLQKKISFLRNNVVGIQRNLKVHLLNSN